MKAEHSQIKPRQEQMNQHAQHADQPEKRAILPAHGSVVRGMKLMINRCGRAEGCGRAVREDDDLSFGEKRGCTVGTLRAYALRDERKGMVFYDLLNLTCGQRKIA